MYSTLAIAHVNSITGRPRRFHSLEVIGVRVFSERVATMILAVEPMIVPLPPKPAPKASAHQANLGILGLALSKPTSSSKITRVCSNVIMLHLLFIRQLSIRTLKTFLAVHTE